MRADEFTWNYFKNKPEVFKEADLNRVITKLRRFADNFASFDDFLI